MLAPKKNFKNPDVCLYWHRAINPSCIIDVLRIMTHMNLAFTVQLDSLPITLGMFDSVVAGLHR